MKNLFYLLLLFFISSCSSKEADLEKYKSYPRYEVVVDEFFKKYSFPTIPEGKYYRFAKTKKGYEILCYSFEKDAEKEEGRDLFWSLEEKKFVNPGEKYQSNDNSEIRDQQKGYHSYQGYSYNRMIYFGYKGCENDIIEELEEMENLTDTLMESLARAYGGKCVEISNEIYNSKTDRKPTSEEVEKYRDYLDRESEIYKNIMKENPAYQCLIGRVDVKYGHQYMHGVYEMDLWGEEERKKEFLDKVEYGPFIKSFAENMLLSCKKNAILFTYGDNDTYPLWYAQEKNGFRKDVAIINTSLLNLPDYIQFVKNKYGLKMMLSDKDYNKEELDAIFFNETENPPVNLDSFLQALKRPELLMTDKNTFGGNRKLIALDINNLKLNVIEKNNNTDSSLVFSDVILFKRRSLYKSEIAQLDILSSNFNDRPVYFAGEFSHGWDHTLNVYLENCGLVTELTPYMEKISMYNVRINVPLQTELLMKKYKFNISVENGFESEGIISNYLFSFTGLTNNLLMNDDLVGAGKVIDKCLKEIPIKQLEGYTGEFVIATACLKIDGKQKVAEELFNQCLDKMEKVVLKTPQESYRMNNFLESMMAALTETPLSKKLFDRCIRLQEKINKSMVKY